MQTLPEIMTVRCERCGHEWAPRKKMVTTCPKCKSPYWDRPRKTKKGEVK